jgi:hypothetical protein
MATAQALGQMRAAWAMIAERFQAYALVLPGDASFICQAEACTAHCCRAFSVGLDDNDVQRMARSSGLRPETFLESEDGRPVVLPLAQPYLLTRSDGGCTLLGPGLRCSQYEGRPNACRLYPHFIVAVDPAMGRPVYGDASAIVTAGRQVVTGGTPGSLVPLLLRHVECPGFTGPPMTVDAFLGLLAETLALQYAGEVPGPEMASSDLPPQE